jgi:ribose-phosphate pyrophosphokinase
MNVIGEVEGRDVIIRDDLVDTAGTLTGAADAIKQQGARRVVAACTHGVLSGKARERIEKSAIEKLYVSDTIDIPLENRFPKLEILSVSEVFSKSILRIHEEKSLSSLFV